MQELEHPEWFLRWVNDYSSVLGVSDELRLAMLRVWWPAFAAAGFVEADFAVALSAIVTSTNPPNWPREHLAAVNRELRASRDERTRKSTAKENEHGAPESCRCKLCGWSGWVVVPLPSCVVGGTWAPPYRTAAVVCTQCGPGLRLRQANRAGEHPSQTIDQYERLHDAAWREHMDEQAAAVRLMIRAEVATEEVKRGSTSAGKMAAQLANGFAPPSDPKRGAA